MEENEQQGYLITEKYDKRKGSQNRVNILRKLKFWNCICVQFC